jgi:ADP-heptose:LPS heptosyltransferase
VEIRVLVVKLGAAGDVLRTTALLHSIKDLYPQSHITWICGQKSIALIRHNPLIDRPLPFFDETLTILDSEHFDLCVNFDLAPEATSIAMRVNANIRKGYGRRLDGSVFAFDEAGTIWLEMSLWDDKKKANQETYQTHMQRILGAPYAPHPIIVPLLPEMQEKADAFIQQHQIENQHPIVGFNVGAGDRWEHKKWTVEGYVELGEQLYRRYNTRPIILYGPADFDRAKEVMAAMTVPFIDAELRPSVMEFVAIVNRCDLVITGDTFALHAALGLGKKVVCLVGPTSAAELELYGQGVILQGDIDCLGCYLTRCGKKPFCMNLLSVETVYQAAIDQLETIA